MQSGPPHSGFYTSNDGGSTWIEMPAKLTKAFEGGDSLLRRCIKKVRCSGDVRIIIMWCVMTLLM